MFEYMVFYFGCYCTEKINKINKTSYFFKMDEMYLATTFRRDRIATTTPTTVNSVFFERMFFIFQRVQVQFLPSFSLISTSKRAFLEVVYQAQSQRVLFDQFSYNLISFGLSVLYLSFYSFDPFSLSADLVYHQDTYSRGRRYGMDFSVLEMTYFGVFAPKKILGFKNSYM